MQQTFTARVVQTSSLMEINALVIVKRDDEINDYNQNDVSLLKHLEQVFLGFVR